MHNSIASNARGIDWGARIANQQSEQKRTMLRKPLRERVSSDGSIGIEGLDQRSHAAPGIIGQGRIIRIGNVGCFQAVNHGPCFQG